MKEKYLWNKKRNTAGRIGNPVIERELWNKKRNPGIRRDQNTGINCGYSHLK